MTFEQAALAIELYHRLKNEKFAGDLYTEIARRIFHAPTPSEAQRREVKISCFAAAYSATGKEFSRVLGRK